MHKHVVIIGGGFGGTNVAKSLRDTDYKITIIDKSNHHLFQPLLYQVATAALSPGDIAVPIRFIFSKQKNVHMAVCRTRRPFKNGRAVESSTIRTPQSYAAARR